MASRVSERRGAEWAASLQDGTMQSLVALRLLLRSGIKHESREALEEAAEQAIRHLDQEIGDLRGLIGEMRTEAGGEARSRR